MKCSGFWRAREKTHSYPEPICVNFETGLKTEQGHEGRVHVVKDLCLRFRLTVILQN